jgi:hypothetical protein
MSSGGEPIRASLTWKLRQVGRWLTISEIIPAESASRVACALLREFAGKRNMTPRDLDVTGEVKRFSYTSDAMTLHLRRIRGSR